jgi:replicative DNA helicase
MASTDGKEKPSPTTPSADIIDSLFELISTGKMKQLLALGPALNGLEIGPGLVTVLGAPPGAGKTTLAMQVAFENLLHNPGFRVVVANRESSMEVLLQRELARQTGVSSKAIRFGTCNATELAKLKKAVDELRPLLTRMSSLDEPGQLPMLMRLLSEEPGLLILDYIQKFAPPGEAKVGVTLVMTMCRQFARAGWAVLALSATARTQTRGRSSQDSLQLNQASFRDSSEIEFQADAAYLLRDMEKKGSVAKVRATLIECVKNRHGEKNHKLLAFNMPKSCFELRAIDSEHANDDTIFEQGEIDYSHVSNPFDEEDGY